MTRLAPTWWERLVLNEVCPRCGAPGGNWCRTGMDARPKHHLSPTNTRTLHVLRQAVARHRIARGGVSR